MTELPEATKATIIISNIKKAELVGAVPITSGGRKVAMLIPLQVLSG
jgi:hypothetical protein